LKLTLKDRAGNALHVIPAQLPWAPRFSPDGRRVAYCANARGQDSSDVWVTDLESDATERLTTDANDNCDPQWSPDGKRIVYSANADDAKDLFIKEIGSGSSRVVTRRPGYQFSADWLRDGSAVLFIDLPLTGQLAGNRSIWIQPMDGSEARPYVATAPNEIGARASPDGRWVAFHSGETGRDEVYIDSYPMPGRKTVVSNRGGIHPAWRRDGKELYYWEGDQLVAVRLEAAARNEPLVVRDRTPLFHAPYPGGVIAMYDVSPDGTRFIIAEGYERANRLVVTLNALSAEPVNAPRAAPKR
jgi:dipeptidyl aminopeptidase/acylaminoacyl peptidase